MAQKWGSATKKQAAVKADLGERPRAEGQAAPTDPELADLRKDLAKQVQATRQVLEQGRQLGKERRDPQGRPRIAKAAPTK